MHVRPGARAIRALALAAVFALPGGSASHAQAPPSGTGQARPRGADPTAALRPAADAGASERAVRGWDAYARGDLSTALRLLTEAASEPEARPWVHYALGFARLGEQDPVGAARSWDRVRKAAPEFKTVYFNLADAYLQTGADLAAVRVLRDARSRWPDDAEVHNALGVVAISRGDLREAVDAFRQAVRIAPGDPAGHFNLGRAHQLRYHRSRRYNAALGRSFGAGDEREQAVESFRKCVSLGGHYAALAREWLASLEWR